MLKTLVVKYTPREDSNTEKLLDTFLEKIANKTKVETLDLVATPPELLLRENLSAYLNRKSGNVLAESEKQILRKMDFMAEQVVNNDLIILAFPIYNFSVPAAIKAWIDSIVQKGITFDVNSLDMSNKKVVVINTSGGVQFNTPGDFSTPLIKRIFSYIGINEVHFTGIMGIDYVGYSDFSIKKTSIEMNSIIDELSLNN